MACYRAGRNCTARAPGESWDAAEGSASTSTGAVARVCPSGVPIRDADAQPPYPRSVFEQTADQKRSRRFLGQFGDRAWKRLPPGRLKAPMESFRSPPCSTQARAPASRRYSRCSTRPTFRLDPGHDVRKTESVRALRALALIVAISGRARRGRDRMPAIPARGGAVMAAAPAPRRTGPASRTRCSR